LTQLSQLLTAANNTFKFEAPLTKCKDGKAASNPQHSKAWSTRIENPDGLSNLSPEGECAAMSRIEFERFVGFAQRGLVIVLEVQLARLRKMLISQLPGRG
jgi:hypothetical protein